MDRCLLCKLKASYGNKKDFLPKYCKKHKTKEMYHFVHYVKNRKAYMKRLYHVLKRPNKLFFRFPDEIERNSELNLQQIIDQLKEFS